MKKTPTNKLQIITPEAWVALSRKLARTAHLNAEQRLVVDDFIKTVAEDTKTRTILGNNRHKSKQDHPTPWNLISAIENRFDLIAIDLAATAKNAKAGEFISKRQNSLKCDWTAMLKGRFGFLNPPFDPVGPWVDKIIEEAIKGARFGVLTQGSIDSKWFWKMFPYCTTYALRKRPIFIGSTQPFPKPIIFSSFNCVRLGAEPGPCGRLHEWDWTKDAGDGRYLKAE
jgi:hypothetical protein